MKWALRVGGAVSRGRIRVSDRIHSSGPARSREYLVLANDKPALLDNTIFIVNGPPCYGQLVVVRYSSRN